MMKKLRTILMISALLLSIGVQSAPVKSIESDGAKASSFRDAIGKMVSHTMILGSRDKKRIQKRTQKIKKRSQSRIRTSAYIA
jgi:hypothetical protein